ncbi:MAG: hypothetical protein CMH85_09885 [Novosphingobium sp.]|nr:hypothetical protein [Novosphingobium sp.]|tara:strand:- start:1461 stop:2153 length:693 start_codon:yes stop_codon:yes gene_type:complete
MKFQNDVDCSHERDLNPQVSRTTWRPVPPPIAGEPMAPFYISILLPGLSTAYLQTVLNRSYNSIRKHKAKARQAAADDPLILRDVQDLMASLSPSDGLAMARVRERCQLPFWSRIAIADYVKAGFSLSSIAAAFRCSPRTVSNVIRNTDFCHVDRALAAQQLNPPGKFQPRSEVQHALWPKKMGVSPGYTAPSRLHRDSQTPTSASDPTEGGNLQPGLTNNSSIKETTRG